MSSQSTGAALYSPKTTDKLGRAMTELPPGTKLHGRVQRIIDERARMAAGDIDMDWGFAENMAYASLIDQGFDCRLVGQDSGRGTFFHRHAVLHNQLNNHEYTPLRHLVDRPDAFRVIDSLLSEEAVLGFEYGYATTAPDTLTVWEGQFGDFANGAQVVIDQFISSGEAFRRGKVGTSVWADPVTAAWLRRAGAGAFFGTT